MAVSLKKKMAETWMSSILLASFGYLLVASLSFLFGLFLSATDQSGLTNGSNAQAGTGELFRALNVVTTALQSLWPSVFIYLVITFTFIIIRQWALDRPKSEYDEAPERKRISTILYLAVFLKIFFFLILIGMNYYKGASFEFFEAILMVPLALPSFAWYIKTRTLLSNKEELAQHNAFSFANRVYYPALFCTFTSFLCGWLLPIASNTFSFYLALTVSQLPVFMYWYTMRHSSVRVPTVRRVNVLLIAAIFLVTPLAPVFSTPNLNGILFALIFSLAIGVSDITQRIYSHTSDGRRHHPEEGQEFYLSGANWGTLLLVPAVPLLALVGHSIPAWFLCIYSALHLIFWIISDPKSNLTSSVSVLFGFFLAFIVGVAPLIGSLYPQLITLVTPTTAGSGYSLLSVIVLLGAVILAIDPKTYLHGFRGKLPLSSKQTGLHLLIGIAVLFIVYTSVLSSVAEKITVDHAIMKGKLWELQQIIILLVASSTVAFVLTSPSKGDPDDGDSGGSTRRPSDAAFPEGNDDSFSNARMAQRPVLLTLASMGRPGVSIISGIAGFGLLSVAERSITIEALTLFLCLTLVTMFGFIVNDIYDLEKDQAGGRTDKLLVTGEVSLDLANRTAATLAILSCCTGLLVLGANASMQVVLIAFLLMFYSSFSRHFPALKGAYTAILCLAPISLAETIGSGQQFSPLIYLFAFVYFVGRELYFDVIDLESDVASRYRTLPTYIGPVASARIAWFLMTLAFISLFPIVSGVQSLILALNLIFLWFLWWYRARDELRASYLTRVNLLAGVYFIGASVA